MFKEIDIYYHCRGCENILSIIDFLEDDDYFYLVFQKMEGGKIKSELIEMNTKRRQWMKFNRPIAESYYETWSFDRT